jgi:hypothetical protein
MEKPIENWASSPLRGGSIAAAYVTESTNASMN